MDIKDIMFGYITFLDSFSDEELGQFVRALASKHFEDTEPNYEGHLSTIWDLVQAKIDIAISDYGFFGGEK